MRSVEERFQDIADAIARARVADKRLRLAASLGDDVGLQIAYQAILHNLDVIGDAIKALPVELLEQDSESPWSQFAALPDVIGHNYHGIVPATIHRTVEEDLGQLGAAVRRLRVNR